MAITLYTGIPGNGKTLKMIHDVKALSEKEGRPVFYHGLTDITLPWTKLDDPRKWFEVPTKAIVVIDEAQEIFRNRSVGQMPPEFVTKLETHRHLGIDLYMTTQSPSFIDPHVRKLTQLHMHMVRIRGGERATMHLWREVRDNPEKNRKDSERTVWNFDKSLYGTYKSAEAHTMKRSFSKRQLFFVALFPVFGLLAAATYFTLKDVMPGAGVKKVEARSSSGVIGQLAANAAASNGEKSFDAVADAKRYVQMSTPRVAGLPQTAPKYDALTVPTRVPVPAMCVQRGSVTSRKEVSCKCYSQQGTPMPTEFNMCVEFARNGFFQEFDADKDRQAEQRTAQGVQAMSSRADDPLPRDRPAGGGASVVAFNSVPDGGRPNGVLNK